MEIEKGYTGRMEKEKQNSRLLKLLGIATSVGTLGLLLWEIFVYCGSESPLSLYDLAKQNGIITTEKQQMECLYTQSIYAQAQKAHYEDEYLMLRDSLRIARLKN